MHTLFENTRIVPLVNASGTMINSTYNGTSVGTCPANDYEYHALIYAGTVANTGTIFLYAIGASQTNTLIGSAIYGSSNGNIIWEVKSDALVNIGTLYTHLGANIAVDASGTWRGGAFWLSRQPRSAGTAPSANGWAAVGTSLV